MPALDVDVGADSIIDRSEETSPNKSVTVLYGGIYERIIMKFQRQTGKTAWNLRSSLDSIRLRSFCPGSESRHPHRISYPRSALVLRWQRTVAVQPDSQGRKYRHGRTFRSYCLSSTIHASLYYPL